MSSGAAADFAAGASAAFTDCVAAVVGAGAALAGTAAGLAADVIAFVGKGDDGEFVSSGLAIAGVAATAGAVVVAVGGMAAAGGASLGIGAALATGAFRSVTAIGAFGGPPQPEISSAKNVAARPGTGIENIFVKDISAQSALINVR